MIECKNIKISSIKNGSLQFQLGTISVCRSIEDFQNVFSILSNLSKEEENKVLYFGKNITDMNEIEKIKLQKDIRVISCDDYFVSSFTIYENLMFVCENQDAVLSLAEEFKIDSFLGKYPTQLSPYEILKASLVRALLLESRVLLFQIMDQKLNKKEQKSFLKLLKQIDFKEKIIVIFTDSLIFDSYCNQIVMIQDETLSISRNSKKIFPPKEVQSFPFEKEKHSLKYEYNYTLFKEFSWKRFLFSIFLFFFCFLLLATWTHQKKSLWNKFKTSFPIHMLGVTEENYSTIFSMINKTYEDYRLRDELAYSLFDESDGILDSYILDGRFPIHNYEVLVNKEYMEENFPNQPFEHQEIIIHQETFTISGVLSVCDDDISKVYLNHPFYFDIVTKGNVSPAIFIPYQQMKEIGKKQEDSVLAVSLDSKYLKDFYLGNLETKSNLFLDYGWKELYQTMNQRLYQTFVPIFIGFYLFLFFLAILLVYQIKKWLQKRKKEFDNLQKISISLDRIYFIVLFDYFYEILWGLIFSILFYFLATMVLFYFKEINLFLSLSQYFFVILLILLYFYFIVTLSYNNLYKITKKKKHL